MIPDGNSIVIASQDNSNCIAKQLQLKTKISVIALQLGSFAHQFQLFCKSRQKAQKSGSAFLHFRYAKIIHKNEFSKQGIRFIYKITARYLPFVFTKKGNRLLCKRLLILW